MASVRFQSAEPKLEPKSKEQSCKTKVVPEVERERERQREKERESRGEEEQKETKKKGIRTKEKPYRRQSVFKVLDKSLSQKGKSKVVRQRLCQKYREKGKERKRKRAERKRSRRRQRRKESEQKKKPYWLQSVFKVLNKSLNQKEKSKVVRQRLPQK